MTCESCVRVLETILGKLKGKGVESFDIDLVENGDGDIQSSRGGTDKGNREARQTREICRRQVKLMLLVFQVQIQRIK